MPFTSLSALALTGAALLAGNSASAPSGPPTSPAPAVTPAPAATSGMMVFVDPESGGLTSIPPTPEAAAELLALEEALSRSSEGLFETKAADGSPMIRLQGRFQNVLMAGTSARGPQALCTTSNHTARSLITPTTEPNKPSAFGREEM